MMASHPERLCLTRVHPASFLFAPPGPDAHHQESPGSIHGQKEATVLSHSAEGSEPFPQLSHWATTGDIC